MQGERRDISPMLFPSHPSALNFRKIKGGKCSRGNPQNIAPTKFGSPNQKVIEPSTPCPGILEC
jgi:hypothetical protein